MRVQRLMRPRGSNTMNRIAHLAGPNSTIQNIAPLVTSNKARAKHNLPLLTDLDGASARFDVLRPQHLAAPVTVYVEQFSAHPLEADAAELYGPPDGYVDSAGRVHKDRRAPATSRPTRSSCVQRTGCTLSRTWRRRQTVRAWEEECAFPQCPRGQGAAGLLSQRVTQLRGDRADRREGHGKPDLRQGRDRLLSCPATGWSHKGSTR